MKRVASRTHRATLRLRVAVLSLLLCLAGAYSVQGAEAPPFGVIDMAVDAADGDTFILTTGMLQVKGWAADPDPAPGGGAPVTQVEVFINGVSKGTATLNQARADIRNAYNRSDFLNSGWTFTASISTLSLVEGTYVVTALAEDSTGRQAQLSSPRTFVVTNSPPSGNKAPLGHIDSAVDQADEDTILLPPANLVVQGWAADAEDGAPVTEVEVFIDGVSQGTATLGAARPDIRDAYSDVNFLNSGWSLTVDVDALSNGVHTVTAVAMDGDSATTALGGARTFRVGNPAPTLASLSPSLHTEGGAGFTLTVKGANFVPTSSVRWAGNARTTTFVSSTELTADIPAGDIASNGTAQVTVVNPTPGGGTSNALTFTILASMAPVVELDLFKVDNGGQIGQSIEESDGTSLSINNDDDDFNGQDDNANPTLDGEQDRRDMAKLVLNVQPWDGLSAPVEFMADGPSGVRVFNEADQEVTLPETIAASRFSSGAISYYVEGRTQSTVIFTLTYDPSGSPQSDAVKVIIGEPTTIKLSFDDGPVSDEPLSRNLTQKVLDALLENRVADSAPATFFVQTHVPFRGGNSVGQAMITSESTAGHHVEFHTGSIDDHVDHTIRVTEPAEDVDGDSNPDGDNGLESDIIRGKARILDLTGRTPVRVRPPFGNTDSAVLASYAKFSLTNTLWDVDSADSTFCSALYQLACLQNELRTTIQAGMDTNQQDFVVLMHDIKPVTTDNLAEILKTIEDAIQHRGRNVQFELLPPP